MLSPYLCQVFEPDIPDIKAFCIQVTPLLTLQMIMQIILSFIKSHATDLRTNWYELVIKWYEFLLLQVIM